MLKFFENKFQIIMNALLIFIIILSVYVYSIHPSLPGGDAGELLSEACILGTAHPPGYPLFILISNFITRIGSWLHFVPWFASVARRVNLLCCLMGACTGSMLYQLIYSYLHCQMESNGTQIILYKESVIKVCAVIGSTLFSFSPLTVEYHTSSEVFALNNLLVSMVLLSAFRITRVETVIELRKESIVGAVISGLALSNQHTSVLFLVPLIVHVSLVLISRIDHHIELLILKLFLAFLAGLSPYLYLILSSYQPSPGSWGDMTTLQGFLRHIFRSEYGTFSLSAGQNFATIEDSFTRWRAYFNNTIDQFSFLGGALFVMGVIHCILVVLRPSNKSMDIFGLTMIFSLIFYLLTWNGILSNLPLSIPMAYEVHARFWMQPNLIYSFLVGVGSNTVLSRIFYNIPSRTTNLCCLTLASMMSYFASRGVSMLPDSADKVILYDFAQSILNTLPNQSLLLSHSDLNWNSVRYLQTCERLRSDITHISVQLLPFPWFQRQIKAGLYPTVVFPDILPNVSTGRLDEGNAVLISRFLRSNLETSAFSGGLYIEMQSIADSDIGPNGLYRGEFSLIPWGLVYRVLPVMVHPQVDLPKLWYPQAIKSTHLVRNRMKRYTSVAYRKGSWEHASITVFWDMHYQLGIHLLSFAIYLSKYLADDHSLVPKYAESLKDASKLLGQVHRIMNKFQATSHPYYDIVKNTALAHMRLYEFLQILPKVEGRIRDITQTSYDDQLRIMNQTRQVLQEYVTYTNEPSNNVSGDKDFPVFLAFYNSLPKTNM